MNQKEMNKQRFVSLLKGTNRKGINVVVNEIEKLGFFEAPASVSFHLHEPGGLMEHSLNVYDAAMKIKEDYQELLGEDAKDIPNESIIISTLLHDICKSASYIPAKKKVFENGAWIEKDTYNFDVSHMPVGHGEKSVIMLLQAGLEMTEAEICAIRWHMGNWDLSQYRESQTSFNCARDKHPLCHIVSLADQFAAGMLETR